MRRGFLLSPPNPKPKSTPQPSSSENPKPSSSESRKPSSSLSPPFTMRRGFLLSPRNPQPSTQNPKPSSSRNPKNPPQNPCPDRLSSLPDQILRKILSLLPTDDMVRTSVLSRRFLRQWTHTPLLHFTRNFSSTSIEFEDYPSIVDLCLSQCSHSHSVLSLRFPLIRDPNFPPTLSRWIRFAAARSVQELTFTPVFCGNYFIDMPSSLFNCRALTTLKINCCSIRSAPSRSGFPSLRTLTLTRVKIEDGPLEDLLSCCPTMESFSMSTVRSLKRVTIRAPLIRHLMIYDCGGLVMVDVAGAPELRRLMYGGDLEKVRVGEVFGKIEEVALFSMTECPFSRDLERWKRLVKSVAHAKILCFNNWIFEAPMHGDVGFGDQPIIFKNAKELHWWPVYKEAPGIPAQPWCAKRIATDSLCGLLSVISDCPFLEHLCVQSTYHLELEENDMLESDYDDFVDEDELCFGENLFSELGDVGCHLSCLRKVRITEFAGRKMEMTLLQYLANKAAALKTVSLHYVGEKKEELGDIRKRLNSVQHASPHVDVCFQEFDEDKVCPKHQDMWYEHMIM